MSSPSESIETLHDRLTAMARRWNVAVDHLSTGRGALVGFGRRDGEPVVLKVVRQGSDEWNSGQVLRAFGGRGVVRLLECGAGAVLLERLAPGDSLIGLVMRGQDDRATMILADVIAAMSPDAPSPAFSTAESQGEGFDWYLARADGRLDPRLVQDARDVYVDLCRSQTSRRLLHGDLQHSNVLHDARRGWTLIDPKGVVAEQEYELGALLRNPHEMPELFTQASVVERRTRALCARLELDEARVLRWAFAQAVLSAVWSLQDGESVENAAPSLQLALVVRDILERRVSAA